MSMEEVFFMSIVFMNKDKCGKATRMTSFIMYLTLPPYEPVLSGQERSCIV
jgi:hypothetical protein